MDNEDACFPSSNGRLSNNITTTGQMQSNGAIWGSPYTTLFFDKPSLSATSNDGLSLHPFEGISPLKYNDSAIQSHLYDSCVIQNHQDMVNRHSMCLNRLTETSKEIEALQQENTQIRAVNRELKNQLSLLMQDSVQKQLDGSSGHKEAFDVVNVFRGLLIGDNVGDGKENCANRNKDREVSDESPKNVIENADEVGRCSLPKSISVRSNRYLKVPQSVASASNGCRTRGSTRPSTSSAPPDIVQKVYLRGGTEEEPLEMMVHNQGMLKTELCNKWQETGTCPYKDQCQFAHGIDELRPVIRHPRYKTEICRMVLAGVGCPYSHRCHFRHALSEQERANKQRKPRALNLHR